MTCRVFWHKALGLKRPCTRLMSYYLLQTSEFFEMKSNKNFRTQCTLITYSIWNRSDKVWKQSFNASLNLQTHKLCFLCSVSISLEKIPITKPWYTFLAIRLSSVTVSVHEAKRDPESLFRFSSKGFSAHSGHSASASFCLGPVGRWRNESVKAMEKYVAAGPVLHTAAVVPPRPQLGGLNPYSAVP